MDILGLYFQGERVLHICEHACHPFTPKEGSWINHEILEKAYGEHAESVHLVSYSALDSSQTKQVEINDGPTRAGAVGVLW